MPSLLATEAGMNEACWNQTRRHVKICALWKCLAVVLIMSMSMMQGRVASVDGLLQHIPTYLPILTTSGWFETSGRNLERQGSGITAAPLSSTWNGGSRLGCISYSFQILPKVCPATCLKKGERLACRIRAKRCCRISVSCCYP